MKGSKVVCDEGKARWCVRKGSKVVCEEGKQGGV